MEVPLTPELEEFVLEKVTSGFYASATEVIGEALRLLKERDELAQNQILHHEQHNSQAVRPLGQDRGLFTLPDDFNTSLDSR